MIKFVRTINAAMACTKHRQFS